MYADCDGIILGHEMQSSLIAEEPSEPQAVQNTAVEYIPAIRNGLRAPHMWLDSTEQISVLDWFGTRFVLMAGHTVDAEGYRNLLGNISTELISIEQLPPFENEDIYDAEELVLVRPDGLIADHFKASEVNEQELAARISARITS